MTPSQPEQHCYLAAGFQAGQGAGKSFTAAMLALAISIMKCDKAPVFVQDSEPAWHFLRWIFEMEGVPLILQTGATFKDFKASLKRAKEESACIHVADQLAAPWRDLLGSFSDESGYIGMQKQNQLRSHWDEFVAEWKALPMHRIAAARLGWEFLNYENDAGKIEFYKGDTKMRAGGGESFGYEVNINCELVAHQEAEKDSGSPKKRRKRVSHVCTVLKDQTSILNGYQFVFKDMAGGYKKDGYKDVLKAFEPHLNFLSRTAPVLVPKANSRELVTTGSRYQNDQQDRTIALENFYGLMDWLYGGSTREAIRFRKVIMFEICGTLSNEELEKRVMTKRLQWAAEVVAKMGERIKGGGEVPSDEAALKTIISMAKDDVAAEHVAKQNAQRAQETLHERQLRESVEIAKKVPGNSHQAFRDHAAKTVGR